MKPFTLEWWLKMHGQCFGQAQWNKMSKWGSTSNMMRYLKLAAWIEKRIIDKYGEDETS